MSQRDFKRSLDAIDHDEAVALATNARAERAWADRLSPSANRRQGYSGLKELWATMEAE